MNTIKFDTYKKNTTHKMIDILTKNNFNEDSILDLSSTFFRPFSTLLMISTLKKKLGNTKYNYIKSRYDYVDKLALYKYFEGGYNYKEINNVNNINLEICTFNVNSFFDYENKIKYNKIMEISDKFAERFKYLAKDLGFQDFFKYAFREMLRNAIEHSYANNVTIYVNKIANDDYFEFAIFDDGRGLEYSLSKNKTLKQMLEEGHNPIDIAMTPGFSSEDNFKYVRSDDLTWKNSGFGLAIVKEMCMRLNGVFSICSNNNLRMYKKYQDSVEDFNVDIKGVGIQVRFHMYNKDLNYQEVFKDVVEKLEGRSIQSASVASKMYK